MSAVVRAREGGADLRRLLRAMLPAVSLALVLGAIAWLNPRVISYFGFTLMLNLAIPIALANKDTHDVALTLVPRLKGLSALDGGGERGMTLKASEKSRLTVRVKERNAEVEQQFIDGGLVLSYQLVELPLPVLVGRTNTHGDVVGHVRSAGVFQKQFHVHRRSSV